MVCAEKLVVHILKGLCLLELQQSLAFQNCDCCEELLFDMTPYCLPILLIIVQSSFSLMKFVTENKNLEKMKIHLESINISFFMKAVLFSPPTL